MVKKKVFAVFWSKQAKQNLKEVYDYIFPDSPKNAFRVVSGIIKLSESLSVSPFRFEACAELPTKNNIYRKATFLPYKIIYRVKNKRVEVLSVFHSSQNPKKLLAVRRIKL